MSQPQPQLPQVFSLKPKLMCGDAGRAPGQFSRPGGVCFLPSSYLGPAFGSSSGNYNTSNSNRNGLVVVVDQDNHRLQFFDQLSDTLFVHSLFVFSFWC